MFWGKRGGFLVVFVLAQAIVNQIVAETSFVEVVSSYFDDVIGASYFEEEVRRASVNQSVLGGDALVREMEKEISDKLTVVTDAVEQLSEALENDESEKTEISSHNCCKMEEMSATDDGYSYKYNMQVKFEEACLIPNSELSLPTGKMLNVAAVNKELSGIRSQRYVGEHGGMIQYPAIMRNGFCKIKNSTSVPWYVATAISGPKDMVAILDASLLKDNLDETLKALEKLANDTISPSDNIGLVVFSDEVQVATESDGHIECSERNLIPGSLYNLEAMMDWMQREKWESGNANYTKAFHTAFDYLDSAPNPLSSKRRKIILFVSKTPPNDAVKDIFLTLGDRNGKLNHAIVIMTYDVSGDVGGDLMASIAKQNGANYDVPKSDGIVEGVYSRVDDVSTLGDHLSSFYHHISPTNTESTQWSWPHHDSAAGMVVTASQSVMINGKFNGAVSVDTSIARLIEDTVNNIPNDKDVYAFVMDENFRVIFHPFLKPPSMYKHKFPIVNIQELESSTMLDDLLSQIKESQGPNADRNLAIKLEMKATWESEWDNSSSPFLLHDSTVSCKSTLPSIFTICVVVKKDSNSELVIQPQSLPLNFRFIYHRLDLSSPGDECAQFKKTSFMGTTVNIAPTAFVDAAKYMEVKEDEARLLQYYNDIVGGKGVIIKDQTIQDIFLTFSLEGLWNKTGKQTHESTIGQMTLWRYVATKNGVLRIYPGSQLPRDFDHKRRPWYRSALKNLNAKFTVTQPYLDAITENWIISFSRSITISTDSGLEIYAVIGFDVVIWKIQEFLTSVDERCSKFCELVHHSGFTFYHPDMLEHNEDFKSHIMEFDPEFSRHLIEEKLLTKQSCFKHEEHFKYEFYQLDTNRLPVSTEKYSIEQVEDANVIFVFIEDREKWRDSEKCEVEIRSECKSHSTCQIPCVNFTKPTCETATKSSIDQVPPCLPLYHLHHKVPVTESDLKDCYEHFNFWNRIFKTGIPWWTFLEIFGGVVICLGCFAAKSGFALNRSHGGTGNMMGTGDMVGTGNVTQLGMMAMAEQNFMGQGTQTQASPTMQQPPPPPGVWSNQAGPQAAPPGYGFNTVQPQSGFPVSPGQQQPQGFFQQPQFPPQPPVPGQAPPQGFPQQSQFAPPPSYNNSNQYSTGFF